MNVSTQTDPMAEQAAISPQSFASLLHRAPCRCTSLEQHMDEIVRTSEEIEALQAGHQH